VIARLVAVAAPVLAALAVASPAQADNLRAGVGRADIEPPTGQYMMGWVRADAKTTGQHTRLWARALVLERNGHKMALVAEDLNGIPGGMLKAAADLVKDRGFSEQNVLDSASHTHAAPSGFYNFGTYNSIFPSMGTLTDPNRVFDFHLVDTTADPVLYSFMVRQLASAIRRADDNLGPASLGWGQEQLDAVTRNRSIEAHLADHGIVEPYGTGSATQDPLGVDHTIDPEVNVMRVDKLVRRCRRRRHHKRVCRRVHQPLGAWSDFSNHGTVNQYTFNVYNRDHHGSADQLFEDGVRRAGKVPRKQDVVNIYGNTDEGDVSAGLIHNGPAWADHVGRTEADKMLEAWRAAGHGMSRTPDFDERWTRICFCGQATSQGNVDSTAVLGLAEFTGSEEGRGPLYDETGRPFEGDTSPASLGDQGHKIQVVRDNGGSFPKAVPLMAIRLGSRVVVSVPGEMTEEMGRRVRAAVLGALGNSGVQRVVISGLANEYLSYFTTPEEYDLQHYEGAATLYGRTASVLLEDNLVDLARRLIQGQPAPAPYAFDPTNGVKLVSEGFDPGPSSAGVVSQPGATTRFNRATFRWRGGVRGDDRPVGRAFVTIQRRRGRRWVRATDDLGLRIIWTVDENGVYTAQWEVPLFATRGTYRFVITANRYRLASAPFPVLGSNKLDLRPVSTRPGYLAVELRYPEAVSRSADDAPLAWRPARVEGGAVTFNLAGRRVTVRRKRSGVFAVKAARGAVSVAAVGALDRYGNHPGGGLRLRD
jgi:neutral ceramidase